MNNGHTTGRRSGAQERMARLVAERISRGEVAFINVPGVGMCKIVDVPGYMPNG